MTNSSTLIVEGIITKRECLMWDNGGDAYTIYTFHRLATLKGDITGTIQIVTTGGLIHFSNGTSAEVVTPEWKNIQIGSRYVAFLKTAKDGHSTLVSGLDSLLEVDQTQKINPIAALLEDPHHAIIDETKELTEPELIGKINLLLQSSKSK